jgi:DNA-binding NarL/FixJ family response regulator
MLALLIDKHPAMLKGVSHLLKETFPKCQIVSALDSAKISDLYNEHLPEIIITEIDFGRGREAIANIESFIRKNPTANVVIYAKDCTKDLMNNLYKNGVKAVILKDSIMELVHAVKEIKKGRAYTPAEKIKEAPSIGSEFLEKDPILNLEEREFKIFLRVVNGASIIDLMREYDLSKRMIIYIKSGIKKKLAVKEDVDLIKLAIQYDHIVLEKKNVR